MMLRHALLAISAVTMLAACAGPTTERPRYSKEEMLQERAKQKAAAEAARINFNDKKNYSPQQIQAFAARLNAVSAPVEQAAAHMCRELTGGRGACNSQVVLAADQKGLNAHADGERVVVYPAMIDFAQKDEHLAFVIAHEFAHNIMGHVQAAQQNTAVGGILGTILDVAASTQGMDTQGMFGQVGASQAQLRFSPQFEHEADYVGLYILARSGYKIDEAPQFWRVMSQAEPDAIYISTTHPSNPERTIQMEKTVAEIHAKQQAGQPLFPNIKKKKK